MAVTVETSPVAIQANSYSAELFRRGTFGWELQRGASIGSVVGGLVGGADRVAVLGEQNNQFGRGVEVGHREEGHVDR